MTCQGGQGASVINHLRPGTTGMCTGTKVSGWSQSPSQPDATAKTNIT